MASRWSDLSRPPLSQRRLAQALARDGSWREVRVVAETGSTNADVAAAARDGTAEGLVVVADRQVGGRGRLDRKWESPARAGVLLSVLLRPPADVSAWPLLPLLSGLAVAEAMLSVGRVEAWLKWPNDVLVDGRKLAGILVERVENAVVVGIGVNVSTRAEELPVDTATSLLLVGGVTDRQSLAVEVLRALARRYRRWCDTAGSSASVIPAYRERCETIGQLVDLHLPGGEHVHGIACAIDDDGRLVVRDETGRQRSWLVGDVTHVRRAG